MRRLILPLALVLALVAGGAGLVASQAVAGGGKGKARVHAGLLKVAADYVDLSKRELRAELRSGKSLAQVAEARGKTRAGLVTALTAAVKAKLDRRLAAQKLTAARHAALLARAQQRIEQLVDRTGIRAGGKAARAKRGLLHAAATHLQLDRAALSERLRAGSSLAEIAAAQGKTRAGLKAALLTAVETRLARNTRFTAEQRAAKLAKADARIERLLDHKRRPSG
jgi:hypothetical protein